MAKNRSINVQNVPIAVSSVEAEEFLSLTDIAAAKAGSARAADVIKNWLRNRTTLEYLGTWEQIYNPSFKVVEFDHFRREAGLHTFVISASDWIERTDAVKNYLIPAHDYREDLHWLPYAEEADLLNVALFGFTARAWRESNPELAKTSNMRDYANINELTVLSNLETHNAQMIREGRSKQERFAALKEIAEYQMGVLTEAGRIGNGIKAANEIESDT